MTHPFDAKLAALGIVLAEAARPAANYVSVVELGSRLLVSGQLPMAGGKPIAFGKLGAEIDMTGGVEAARVCGINILTQVRSHLGGFERVDRLVRLGAFVASSPDFHEQPKVVNGASDLMAEVMGEAGIHARAAVGVAVLPLNVPVEIEAEFALKI